MNRFEIYSSSLLVGWSDLELGDPPMGVAFGKFNPTVSYAEIQQAVIKAGAGEVASLNLSVRLTGGPELQATGGVQIADYSAEVGEDGIEVSVLGITYPEYDLLFPDHLLAYEKSLKGGA
jgi:hypothetical protein